MDLATAVERLEAAGTEQNRKIYRRHGARVPLYGVSFALLGRVAAAGRIGPVTVDHGRTGCVTPAAIPYIDRTWARNAARMEASHGTA